LDTKGIAPWQLWKREADAVSGNGDRSAERDPKKLTPFS